MAAAAGVVLAAALGVDRVTGDPQSRYHPVALLGRLIGWWGEPGRWDPRVRRAAGVICGFGTACLFALPFLLVDRFAPLGAVVLRGPCLLQGTFSGRAREERARPLQWVWELWEAFPPIWVKAEGESGWWRLLWQSIPLPAQPAPYWPAIRSCNFP